MISKTNTMKFHGAPMVPSRPSKILFCSENFCKPYDYIRHPFQSSPYILGIPFHYERQGDMNNSCKTQSINTVLLPWCWLQSNWKFRNHRHIFLSIFGVECSERARASYYHKQSRTYVRNDTSLDVIQRAVL